MFKANQGGNVLFLILIAVVLFAALSYAVTQSSRGGGNADRETTRLLVSRVNNDIARFRTEFLRRSVAGDGFPPLLASSGGFYDPAYGVPALHPPLEMKTSGLADNTFTYILVQTRFILDTNDVGTSAEDYYLYVLGINDDVCAQINNELYGSTIRPDAGLNAGPTGRMSSLLRDGTEIDTAANVTVELGTFEEGCFFDTSWWGNAIYMQLSSN